MRKVYTYRSILELKDHPCSQDIFFNPHITATKDLAEAMKSKYPEIACVEDIHAIQKKLVKEWENPDIQFSQFLTISRVIRLLRVSEEEETIHGSFIKNKVAVMNAIRLLVEADVSSENISPKNTEEKLFKRIWEQVEIEDESYSEFRIGMEDLMSDPHLFQTSLSKLSPFMESDVIILHGFYFVTPIQERIFDMMENAGKKLVFLCCIDRAVPEVEDIWHQVLSQTNKFDPEKEWVSQNSPDMCNTSFGSVFGEEPTLTCQENITVIKYDSEIDMVRDMDRILDNEMQVYSPDTKTLDEILKEFYPQIYKRRHLLSYPVGQYIYHLHSMWSAKDNCLVLTIDDVQACFASGWLQVDGINGIDFVDHLEGLKTYVSDCKTVEDWEARLDLLQNTKDAVLYEFEKHVPEMPIDNQRWHRMMADPFLNLSCFNCDALTLQHIISLIRHLIYTAKQLFTGRGEISISSHLAKVRQILSQGRDEKRLLKEEEAILEELSSRLHCSTLGVDRCLPGEISEAIMLIIGGGILDEDNYEFQSGSDETFVKPLYQIESAPITSNGKLHICLADENRLPGKTKSYIWPLNDDLLDRLTISDKERRSQYLKDMRFIIHNQPLAARYLFFSALQNSQVEISWITKDEGKDIASSPYIQILHELFGVEITPYRKNEWKPEIVSSIVPAQSPDMLSVDFSDIPATECQLDLVVCPWRYIYGYGLSVQPSYSSDFHYGFVLSNIVGAIAKVTGKNVKDVGKEVFSLFPYLRPIEKQQIQDYVPWKISTETDSLDRAAYPQARLLSHFLRKQIIDEAENALSEILQETSTYEADLVNVGSYELCKYCPHVPNCPHAKHDAREDERNG